MNDERATSAKPLVVAVCAVPLLQEALATALEDIAEVQSFPAHRGDTVGLLRWLKPDAVVVDAEDEAEAAASFGYESNAPVLHISLRDRKLRLLRDGDWEEAGNGGTSSEEIRNILAAGLFARRRAHERG
jgi:hypothetical protein